MCTIRQWCVLTVTFQSELFSPNLISLEFNSLLYFFSFTIDFGSVSSENNKTSLLSAHSTGYGAQNQSEMLTRANNYEKWKRDVKEYLSSMAAVGIGGIAVIYALTKF